MVLLNGTNLKKMFFDETLFSDVSFNIADKDKIGFVGINGAGKSTLFKIINGMSDYDDGEIYKNKLTKIGYLDQYTCIESQDTTSPPSNSASATESAVLPEAVGPATASSFILSLICKFP